MSNMSYCRFRNTAPDLEDCKENLFDRLHDRDEDAARTRLVRYAIEIVRLCAEEHGMDDDGLDLDELEDNLPKSLNDWIPEGGDEE